MQIFEELKARGLLAQLTDEEEIRDLINNGKATFYIGFDPTADSLHVGHFMALCLMKRLQMAGNKPIALIGGGTARVKFTNAMYAGKNDVEVEVKRVSSTHYQVIASGETVLFIEFGTGINNPELVEPSGLTYQHGTYGKGHGADPNGWVYVGEQGNAGQPIREGVYRTYGNPPAKAMYYAAKDMKAEIYTIAKEVFG